MHTSNKICQHNVVIVGGGPAGISAARTLSQNKINCCIIEARNRFGGKAHSEYWEENISIDYGPQWIHNVPRYGSTHLFVKIANNELNLDIEHQLLEKESRESNRYHRKRLIWDEQSKQEIANILYNKIIHSSRNVLKKQVLSEKYSHQLKHKNLSIYDGFKDSYHQIMSSFQNNKEIESFKQNILYINNDINVSMINRGFMERCIDKMVCNHECADGPLTQESLYHYHDDSLGGYNIYMQGKYGHFIKMISDNLDKKYVDVCFNTTVKTIKYNINTNDEYNMEIKCQNGIIYKAKHVIICIPIGCLQNRNIEFIPKLRDSFWNSIDHGIGITNCDKLILQFDGLFPCKNEVTSINIVNYQSNYKMNESIPGENQNYGNGFRMGVDWKDRSKYNIWCIFISPHFWARKINNDESKDNEEQNNIKSQNECILKNTLRIFMDMFGNGNNSKFPKLKRYHITRWDIDEYSKGCWCFMKKEGNGAKDCENISNAKNIFDIKSENIKDNNIAKKLQFAGDYAVADGIGTVLAAFNAGTTSANNIISLHKT